MNQILVTEKLYVTPELKRKKRFFKIEFFLSIFLVCILSSYYIYAEYDRTKSEQVSQELLSQVRNTTTEQAPEDDVIILILDKESSDEAIKNAGEIIKEDNGTVQSTYEASNGNKYKTEAVITIPKIGISYPILSKDQGKPIEDLLEISISKFFGPEPNEIGNYCVVGHNYRNGKMFGRLSELVDGDIVKLEDLSGRMIKYQVYGREVVNPTDTSCTSQEKQRANKRRELTLITCTNYGTQRLAVKCREI